MTRILAIDPGTKQSGWCLLSGREIVGFGIAPNEEVVFEIPRRFGLESYSGDCLAIEMIASYGMAVGAETFRTVWWAGRFAQAWNRDHTLIEVYRADVKSEICRTQKAKDANIRQAIIDRYGGKDAAIGKKANPGPLHGISSHVWAALAVAITVQARLARESEARAA